MQSPSNIGSRWWRNAILFLIALVVVTSDQLSKLWLRSALFPGESSFEAGLFRIVHVQNTGAAFGLFRGHSLLLTIVALVGIAVFLVYIFIVYRRFSYLDNTTNRIALGLILGGTVGNLTDRLRLGYVTDFIDFTYWPAFNVADSAVTVGALLFAYSLISIAREEKP
jgi:signal peptidase II